MTATAETTAPRQNAEGQPCPPWCTVDHTQKFHEACISRPAGIDQIWACAVRRTGVARRVAVSGSLPDPLADWPHLNLDLREAEHLAVLVELLADATPDDHRQLAAAIRQALAVITEVGGA